ncbi:hypothetical protein FHS16_003868 [Paenibacillus endophyticus]|uniref:Uncharacterized protein n=1 Tax=Paenibacillus endophyticus TaxID=1294268 RepID=A0A7W5C9W6_9BACL|nr:hypothetical protein [Paenibacillus endophyticus]MBB3153793.1 hypothetical protein [Paenibacillus endophyticus]
MRLPRAGSQLDESHDASSGDDQNGYGCSRYLTDRARYPLLQKSFIKGVMIGAMIILVPIDAVSIFASLRSEQILERRVDEQTRIALSSAMEGMVMTMNNIENMYMALATDTNPADLTIASIENEGTTVLLRIPIGGAYESHDRRGRASSTE